MNTKQLKRLKELKALEGGFVLGDGTHLRLTHNEFVELRELEYIQQKQYITFRLPQDSEHGNKYYFAHLTKSFSDILKKDGHKFYNEEKYQEILKENIYFHSYKITIGPSIHGTEIKSFRNKQALLDYLEGYVDSHYHSTKSFNNTKSFNHLVGHGQIKGEE